LTRLGCIWTLARLAWAFIALESVMKGWMSVSINRTYHYYCIDYILLILIFLLSEVIPIFISLQETILSSFSGSSITSTQRNHEMNNNNNNVSISLMNKLGLHQDLSAYGSIRGILSLKLIFLNINTNNIFRKGQWKEVLRVNRSKPSYSIVRFGTSNITVYKWLCKRRS